MYIYIYICITYTDISFIDTLHHFLTVLVTRDSCNTPHARIRDRKAPEDNSTDNCRRQLHDLLSARGAPSRVLELRSFN